METWSFLVNRVVFPYVLTFVFVVLTLHFESCKHYMIRKYPSLRFEINYIFRGLDVRRKPTLAIFFASIVVPPILSLFLSYAFGVGPSGDGAPLGFALLTSGFLNPISEEFLTRGLLLSIFMLYGEIFIRKGRLKSDKTTRLFIQTVSLVVVSIPFVLAHNNHNIYQLASRFLPSILYGVLYLLSDRNLLPAIVAHSAWNVFLALNDVP